MRNKKTLLIGGAVVLVVALALGWWLGSPLFINRTVDEAFPFELPEASALAEMSDDEMKQVEAEFMAAMPDEDELMQLNESDFAAVQAKVEGAAAAMPDHVMDEPMPENEPVVVGQGQFQGADDFHMGSGQAAVYRLPDGSHVLRFEDFDVTNGPDLHVLLIEHPNPTNRAEIMESYIDLGSLKGNIGNQNYEIPADADVSQYQSIVIYCQPFHVIFSTATLQPIS